VWHGSRSRAYEWSPLSCRLFCTGKRGMVSTVLHGRASHRLLSHLIQETSPLKMKWLARQCEIVDTIVEKSPQSSRLFCRCKPPTYPYVSHDSPIRMTWLVHVWGCAMTHSCVCHDSFIWVIWVCIRVTCLAPQCTWMICTSVSTIVPTYTTHMFKRVTEHVQPCDRTCSNVWQNISIYDTHSIACRRTVYHRGGIHAVYHLRGQIWYGIYVW